MAADETKEMKKKKELNNVQHELYRTKECTYQKSQLVKKDLKNEVTS